PGRRRDHRGREVPSRCFFQAEDGIRDRSVTGVQTCALPISEGDSPVCDNSSCPIRILSTAEHEKFRRKLGRPFPKPKYYLVTDSEPVPRGKGEKNPGRGVKRT